MLKDVSEQRKKSNVDWLFVILIAVTLLINLIVLSSASSNVVEGDPYFYLKRQGLWIAIGAVLFFLVSRFNYEKFRRMDLLLYGIIIILLIAVLFTPETKGAHRWFDLGFIDFQPSELAKIVLIVVFACFLARNQGRLHEPKKIVTALVMMLIPWGLILIEPDLGTALVLIAVILTMAFVGGFPKKILFITLLIIAALAAFLFISLYFYTDGYQAQLEEVPAWLPLKKYQLTRLIIFINPYMDPLNAGYNMIQSKVAIGSGGFFGKGFGNGTQVQGDFLPEHHTDFIFSVVGEEFGFLGSIGILFLYLLILLRTIRIALHAKDLLGRVIVLGITAMLTFQIFINVGMTVGIMPVTGITLPLLSYGGSSMLINMIALGLVFGISLRSNKNFFD
ncbi:MAG: rod shape-determining protein RodA [Bacillota bacterium]|jgi:rod shape determining protein RodA